MRLIATDGVFSMDGHIADLRSICDLADRYNALVFVDDAHATGFVGKTGRGTAEHCGVQVRSRSCHDFNISVLIHVIALKLRVH